MEKCNGSQKKLGRLTFDRSSPKLGITPLHGRTTNSQVILCAGYFKNGLGAHLSDTKVRQIRDAKKNRWIDFFEFQKSRAKLRT